MGFPKALGSIDPRGGTIATLMHILKPGQKFSKPLSSHVDPAIFIFRINFESVRHRGTNKREWQFCVKGGVGKLVESWNFLPNVVRSLTGTSGEIQQFSIDFAVWTPFFEGGNKRFRKPGLFAVPCDAVSWLSAWRA